MIDLHYTTSTMLRQRAAPGLVCRVALLTGFDGRSVPIIAEVGGGAP
jgi:hypothetical protein